MSTGCRRARSTSHGPLQEQRPRHRVQPVRGVRHGRTCSARRPFADVDARHRPRDAHARSTRLAEDPLADVVRRRRPQPAGLRPGDPLGRRCPSRSRSPTRPAWTASGGAWTCPPSSAAPASRRRCGGRPAELGPRRQPGRAHVHRPARPSPACSTATATTEQKKLAQLMIDRALGRDDGAHRAGRRLRRRRRPHQGRRSSPTAPGTSRASSGSSPRPSTT